jgi:hypothetical protein
MSQIDKNWLWHRRTGYINFDNLVKVSNKEVVRGMPKIINPSSPFCKNYQHGKQKKVTYKRTIKESTKRSSENSNPW